MRIKRKYYKKNIENFHHKEVENRKIIQKSNEIKSWLFKQLKIIDKSLSRWTNKKIEEIQIKIRNESGDVTPDSTEVKRVEIKYVNYCIPINN